MSAAFVQKIESLSSEDQQEVEKFIDFLRFRSSESDSLLNNEEELEIHRRLSEMKNDKEASQEAKQVFAEMRARYGR